MSEKEYVRSASGGTLMLSIEAVVEEVILKWPGACLAGRLEAAQGMLDEYSSVPECFEYIEENHEGHLETFVERCGWEIVEQEKSWPIVGRWYANSMTGAPWRVVGYWDHEDGDGSMHESLSTQVSEGYSDQVVYVMNNRFGDIDYVGWDAYEGVEGNGWVEVPPPTMTRDDFYHHPGWPARQYHQWRWDRDLLQSLGLPADEVNTHLHGEIVGLTFRCETNGDSLFTIKAWETANDGHIRVRYAGPDFINVQTRRVW